MGDPANGELTADGRAAVVAELDLRRAERQLGVHVGGEEVVAADDVLAELGRLRIETDSTRALALERVPPFSADETSLDVAERRAERRDRMCATANPTDE